MNENEMGVNVGGVPMADAPETHSLIPQPHPSSLFVNRWRHRDKLVFRVWPMYKETHRAIVIRKEIPIDGFMATKDGRMVAMYHSKEVRECAFEVKDEDMELMAAASEAGARLRLDEMTVLAPGTEDETTKKECWLEVPFDAYPTAPYRTRSDECRSTSHIAPKLSCIARYNMAYEKCAYCQDWSREGDPQTRCFTGVDSAADPDGESWACPKVNARSLPGKGEGISVSLSTTASLYKG